MRRCRGSRATVSVALVVNGEEQTRDMIALPERVVTNWQLADGQRLVIDDRQAVRDGLPAHLVVSTGSYGRMRPIRPSLIAAVRRRRSTWVAPVWSSCHPWCEHG